MEWSGGPETMEEILNRIQQRETAAAKRERTMAYAFSHQACQQINKDYDTNQSFSLLKSPQRFTY